MRLDEVTFLRAVGKAWKRPEILDSVSDTKYMARSTFLLRKLTLIDRHLPEYKAGGFQVVDISCASGALLEALRFHGNKVLGTDVQYFPFLKSQNIPYRNMDCTKFPYPLEDKSFDLLTCLGAITFYRPFVIWPLVLEEFARIARKTIFLIVNRGNNLNTYGNLIDKWRHPEWRRVLKKCGNYKWERV